MERLPNSVLENAIRVFVIGEKSALDKCVLSFLKELQELRDAEENGLLVRLPLKKGSKVYSAKEEYTVTEISCFDDFELKFIAKNDYSAIRFNVKEIGKTVFLTKAEAEGKLKEMEGEDANNCNDTKSTK